MAEHAVDLEAVKEVQQRVWSQGDFSRVGSMLAIVGEELCEAVDVLPGEQVLDVACGAGTATIAAARRTWNTVTGVDYVPELLERGRARAEAERLDVDWVEGDAEALPFDDASFDVVLSTFGVMFAPDHRRAAQELLRVCRPGGRIGLANWTPGGFTGSFFRAVAEHAPPPPGVQPPPLWGTEEHLRELLGAGTSSVKVERKDFQMRFVSADQWIEFFRSYFGPVRVAFERVGAEGEQALADDLRAVLDSYNRAGERALVMPGEYLEVVAVRA